MTWLDSPWEVMLFSEKCSVFDAVLGGIFLSILSTSGVAKFFFEILPVLLIWKGRPNLGSYSHLYAPEDFFVAD